MRQDGLCASDRARLLQIAGGTPMPWENFKAFASDIMYHDSNNTIDMTPWFSSYPEIDLRTYERDDNIAVYASTRYKLLVLICKIWENADYVPTANELKEFHWHTFILWMQEPDMFYIDHFSFHLHLSLIRTMPRPYIEWVKQQETRLFIVRLAWSDLVASCSSSLSSADLSAPSSHLKNFREADVSTFLDVLEFHIFNKCIAGHALSLEDIIAIQPGEEYNLQHQLINLRAEIRRVWLPSLDVKNKDKDKQLSVFSYGAGDWQSVVFCSGDPLPHRPEVSKSVFAIPTSLSSFDASSSSSSTSSSNVQLPKVENGKQFFDDPQLQNRLPPCILNIAMKKKSQGLHLKNEARYPLAQILLSMKIDVAVVFEFLVAFDGQCNKPKVLAEVMSLVEKKDRFSYGCNKFIGLGLCPFSQSFAFPVQDIEDIVKYQVNNTPGFSTNQCNQISDQVKSAMMTHGPTATCSYLCKATPQQISFNPNKKFVSKPSDFYFSKPL